MGRYSQAELLCNESVGGVFGSILSLPKTHLATEPYCGPTFTTVLFNALKDAGMIPTSLKKFNKKGEDELVIKYKGKTKKIVFGDISASEIVKKLKRA